MSTGGPSLSVDLTPPVNGHHNHGHTRRGHSRSNRWAQPPPPIPQPVNSLPQPETNGLNSSYSYGHAHQSSNGHTHSHSSAHHDHHDHSHAHHDHGHHHDHHDHDHDHHSHHGHHGHTHSVSSVHNDALHNHDSKSAHGFIPVDTTIKADSNPDQIHEIFTGALIVLPWIVLSWHNRQSVQTPGSTPTETATVPIPIVSVGQVGQKTCILTAITLVLFGCGQLLRIKLQKTGSLGASSIKFPAVNAKAVQASLSQIVSVALPIFAALKVGGFLVAFALLLATATGVPTIINGNPRSLERYSKKKLSIALLALATATSFLGLNYPWDPSPFFGYVALLVSIFIIAPPFPFLRQHGPIPEPGLVALQGKSSDLSQSSVVATTDAPLAVISGSSLALFTLIFTRGIGFGMSDVIYLLVPTGLFALSLMASLPEGLRSSNKIGLAICAGAAALLCSPHMQDDLLVLYGARGILATASFFASRMDDGHLHSDSHAHNHTSHSHSHATVEASRVSKWLLHKSEPYPLLHSILKEKDSRSIFYFMCLNFTFMLVQLSYGFLTGSLGLLSDSIHMFFDCLALVVGLCAAVMSKWPPNARFPYGYGKVDTLSGFANGIFLMIISVEIIYEAVERLSSGSEMQRIGELLVVSIAGLAVNLVGIFSFEHGHHHGHDHGHDHSHGNENMHGIFLHILADTLGSVAVVISTILVHYSGWSGYDPLASCFIAILIFASAVPLVTSTAKSLLLTLPADIEYNVRETLAGVSTLRGVVSYTVPKFWLDDTGTTSEHSHSHDHSGHGECGHQHDHSHSTHHNHNHDHGHSHTHSHSHAHDHDHEHDHEHEKKPQNIFGVIHVIASRGADLEDVRQRTVDYLREKNMDILVQVERDGDARCWCGGGSKGL
ncbi:hypothetical protein N7499_012116 [Penicillium canescens]|nr:hypothetical protein N7499_012116 [Penicillium canescens]KAJ6175367.1 hypothetical protein N7485_002281 [Penicillium canescens]